MSVPEPDEDMVAMRVGGIVVDPRTQVPVIVLRGLREPRLYLPIFIGGLEATAIATVLAEVTLPRPMTHDLLATMLVELSCQVERITVTKLVEGTFFAEITLVDPQERELAIDARPSDSIALALRVDAPIFVAKGVVVEAGAMSPLEGEAEEEVGDGVADQGALAPPEVDEADAAVAAVDDAPPAALLDPDSRLEDLDPEDFGKYKM